MKHSLISKLEIVQSSAGANWTIQPWKALKTLIFDSFADSFVLENTDFNSSFKNGVFRSKGFYVLEYKLDYFGVVFTYMNLQFLWWMVLKLLVQSMIMDQTLVDQGLEHL